MHRRPQSNLGAFVFGCAVDGDRCRLQTERLFSPFPSAPMSLAWQNRLTQSIVSHLDPAWLSAPYRTQWSPDNPTAGFCSVAAEAAYFLLGGPRQGWMALVAPDPAGGTHWWLERQTARGLERFDPTADQYVRQGKVPPYEAGRPCPFMGQRKDLASPYGFERKPGLRAAKLLAKLMGSSESVTPITLQAFRAQVGLDASGATPSTRPSARRSRHP